jgi:hypothetical protein
MKVLGVDYPDTLASMTNLAVTRKSQGRDVEALRLRGLSSAPEAVIGS